MATVVRAGVAGRLSIIHHGIHFTSLQVMTKHQGYTVCKV